jgi:polyhydroxyalkanoate synthesis regulator phasin
MARRDAENIISKLRQMSEEGLGSVMGELMANERMRKGLGRAGERLMANKHVFDRNVETVLDFVNIPSKRDIRELKSRLDTLSSQLVNLSMKIDRMLAAGEMPASRHARSGSNQIEPEQVEADRVEPDRVERGRPVRPVRPVRPAPGPRPVPRRRRTHPD